MHITGDRAHANNIIGAWALTIADAIHTATDAETGISGAAAAALVAIAADPEMTIDELRRALDLTHPGAVRLANRLQDLGWLERQPGRGRAVHLHLTSQGHEVQQRLLQARSETIQGLTSDLDPDSLAQLAELISPALTASTTSTDRLRHLCRLCNRQTCDPCPVAAGL